uniref:Uncharacterized protein n=1 Tax=Arundo donax TaxID=35708 RepID=A0A0A9C7H0_ARUDO
MSLIPTASAKIYLPKTLGGYSYRENKMVLQDVNKSFLFVWQKEQYLKKSIRKQDFQNGVMKYEIPPKIFRNFGIQLNRTNRQRKENR